MTSSFRKIFQTKTSSITNENPTPVAQSGQSIGFQSFFSYCIS